MRTLLLANGLNVALDPCLIFGLGPFPELGLTGAAISTVIGRGTGVLYQFWILRRGRGRVVLRGPAFRVEMPILLEILRLSAGTVGQFLIATTSWVALMRIVAPFGEAALAGYTIAIRIVVFAFLPAWGFSNAALADSPWHGIRSTRRVSSAFLHHRHSQRGNVVVEAALALPVLLILILAIFDYARIHHTRTRLQDAVSQATRFAITGRQLADPGNPGVMLSRKDSVLRIVRDLSGIHDLDADNVKISSISGSGVESSGPGGPGDVVVVEVSYSLEVIAPFVSAAFPDKRYRFTCSSRFRNEEFS